MDILLELTTAPPATEEGQAGPFCVVHDCDRHKTSECSSRPDGASAFIASATRAKSPISAPSRIDAATGLSFIFGAAGATWDTRHREVEIKNFQQSSLPLNLSDHPAAVVPIGPIEKGVIRRTS